MHDTILADRNRLLCGPHLIKCYIVGIFTLLIQLNAGAMRWSAIDHRSGSMLTAPDSTFCVLICCVKYGRPRPDSAEAESNQIVPKPPEAPFLNPQIVFMKSRPLSKTFVLGFPIPLIFDGKSALLLVARNIPRPSKRHL
ncbi:hypothetical protein HRR83_000618 [Exophiala dermatitidis]|nr:hypothetical protein HRR74_000621 [Exophiala dermatitidis]KAJ4528500.1 hypothetical protein HRR73_001123 [Exophiala dermatitidis]KAJ4607402.1 hypothetical protein HRR84_000706 [Exophiala dermatitidis]KAJ4608394.1 hypothetical protein HRR83_000618 [Exophiala dermatitidis]KAJ4621419.1 hypothetical protein HRR85_001615 [Exophiala dermatitidis]